MTDNRTTELLRKLLDERGVEYETDERNAITKWSTHYGAFVYFARQREGKLLVETTVATEHSVILTPEQAIVATLGAQTAGVAEKIEELRRTSLKFPPNIRRKVNIALNGIEQAIADELNKTLGDDETINEMTGKPFDYAKLAERLSEKAVKR